MILIDFLIYYLTKWYTKKNYLNTWSTPINRACFTISLIFLSLMFSISILFHESNIGILVNCANFIVKYNFILYILIYMLIKNVYSTNSRFNKLENVNLLFTINFNQEQKTLLTFIIFLTLFLSPFFLMFFYYFINI